MCGIAGIAGEGWQPAHLEAMAGAQEHRGPDDSGVYISPDRRVGLAHRRLSIIDLSAAGRQPMSTPDGRLTVTANGEIYNYLELRAQLSAYDFRTATDIEVLLAAWQRWGPACLDRLLGMFAFALWDAAERRLYCARDRFGVKPLRYTQAPNGRLSFASETAALFAGGVAAEPDLASWSTYLTTGLSDHGVDTFWRGVRSLPAGHLLAWRDGDVTVRRWYDLAARAGGEDDARPEADVREEYAALLEEAVRLRFRSDVPVAINLSGGLDSSTLLATVDRLPGAPPEAAVLTFVTGDPAYDELAWVERMLAGTAHRLLPCPLAAAEAPAASDALHAAHLEPFGGLPTLAYAALFRRAREDGLTVLLDGQGMDEQWAGYDYYRNLAATSPVVQGTTTSPVRPRCLAPEFRRLAAETAPRSSTGDALRDLQVRDLVATKIPRALRYNDAVSMRHSIELREPFLDHRLVELALRQPRDRKIRGATGKWLLRDIARRLAPAAVVEAPKRALQTPQREWLRGPLREWVETKLDRLERGEVAVGWFLAERLREEWAGFLDGASDNSFYVWQWVGVASILAAAPAAAASVTDALPAYR